MAQRASAAPHIQFQKDLASLPLYDVIRKYISTGQPSALAPDEYFDLRRTVANEFALHPSDVIVVGSSRMGFSIKPAKRYASVTSASDIDLAIVSQPRFDDYWDRVFEYSRSNLSWQKRKFLNTLFNGWIDPRWLPPGPLFAKAKQWAAFFDGLMNSRKFGTRRITARLYRSWARLEAYQELAVAACKNPPKVKS